MKAKEQTEAKRLLCERAYGLFREFRGAYIAEWQRLERCERMYRGDHWHDVPQTDKNEPRPVTPIIQSTVENVKAELMDRLPEAVILPESPADAEVARVIEAIIKQNHDADGYAKEYRKLVHDLLVGGYCVQEVGYDNNLNGGLGGAFIRHVDARSILFDPLATDAQEGRAVFKLSLKTREYIGSHFPKAASFLTADALGKPDAMEDGILHADRQDAVLFLEYWWREYDAEQERYSVHMAQIAGNQVLADSRDAKPFGLFEHGLYPFVITPMFMRKGSCLGLGIVDMFETQQKYADKLDQIVLKNALMASHNKLLVTEASGFDTDDLRDWSKEVHSGESLSGVTWFSTPPLPAYIIGYIQSIRESIMLALVRGSTRLPFYYGVSTANLRVPAVEDGAVFVTYRYMPEPLRVDTDVPDLPEWCHGALISYAVGRERASGDTASLNAARACFELYNAAKRLMRANRGEMDAYEIQNR